jgi:hypothetical protein
MNQAEYREEGIILNAWYSYEAHACDTAVITVKSTVGRLTSRLNDIYV